MSHMTSSPQTQGDVVRWIPVSEQLPDDYRPVLLSDGNETVTGFFLDGVFCRHDGIEVRSHTWITTHWMPLPAAPASAMAQAGDGK